MPVQLGAIDLIDTWRRIKRVLGGARIIPAMPMRAAAATVDQVVAFLQATGERQVHLLGTSKSAHMATLDFFCPGLVITADANQIRAHVGEGRPISTHYRDQLQDLAADEWQDGGEVETDGTEFIFEALNSPGFLSAGELGKVTGFLRALGHHEAVNPSESLNSQLPEALSELVAVHLTRELHSARVAKQRGPDARRAALTYHFARRCGYPQHGRLYAQACAA